MWAGAPHNAGRAASQPHFYAQQLPHCPAHSPSGIDVLCSTHPDTQRLGWLYTAQVRWGGRCRRCSCRCSCRPCCLSAAAARAFQCPCSSRPRRRAFACCRSGHSAFRCLSPRPACCSPCGSCSRLLGLRLCCCRSCRPPAAHHRLHRRFQLRVVQLLGRDRQQSGRGLVHCNTECLNNKASIHAILFTSCWSHPGPQAAPSPAAAAQCPAPQAAQTPAPKPPPTWPP